jgi:hypothetical protein
MSSDLKVHHRPPKNQLAKIEREYQKALCQKARQAVQVKSRKGFPFIPRPAEEIGILEPFPGFRSREKYFADWLAPDEEELGL